MDMMKIPFVDLKALHDPIRQEIDSAISDILNSNAYILGKVVEDFEVAFAEYCGTKYALGVSSGTAALHLALTALNIGWTDEVITVPNTFFATAEAISHTGATPAFVDIDSATYNMDASLLEKTITKNTKAIIPVHLYGLPCDLDPIISFAREHSLYVIEDCAQAHGALYKGNMVGSFGDIGCFSFYPTKNLGALGEGGAVVTNDEELYRKMKLLRAHGEYPKNDHNMVGFNYRMDGIQGAVLGTKIKHLDQWNDRRRKVARWYNEYLSNSSAVTPFEPDYAKHVYHLYVIRHNFRWNVADNLRNKDIGFGMHYSRPIHLQTAYSGSGWWSGQFYNAELHCKECLSLPMHPYITQEQVKKVCAVVKEYDYDNI